MATNGDPRAHLGFSKAFISVSSLIISTVGIQLSTHHNYSLVATGHSAGASLASMSAILLKVNFPASTVRMYTFGQVRTGNPAFAELAENTLGLDNIFRAVHTNDGAPRLISESLGYRHHAVEYWQFVDPPTAANVRQCVGGEDPTCSDSIPDVTINLDNHGNYFGQGNIASDPSACD